MKKFGNAAIYILIMLCAVIAVCGFSACDFLFGTTGGGNTDVSEPSVCEHAYGEWEDEVNTCTEHIVKRTCEKCGKEETRSRTPSHDLGEWEDLQFTCYFHVQAAVCRRCGETSNRTLSAPGHSFGEWEDVIDTCTEHTQKQICDRCGEENTRELETSGHSFGEWEDVFHNCYIYSQKQTCDYCGDENYRSLDTDHTYQDGKCVECGKIYNEDTAVLDKYNSSYGYSYFVNSGYSAEAELYLKIDEAVRKFHTGDADAQLNGGVYVADKVNYSGLGLSSDRAASVWKTYKDDNPLYYWLSSTLAYTVEDIMLVVADEYADSAARMQANEFVYGKAEEYSAVLSKSDNAYRKALAFHDLIISAVDYAYDDSGVPQSAAWAHSIMGVFSGQGAVCEGYAKTFQLLLNYNGVKNMFVTGTGNNEEHAWNLVCLDDGSWYWCDLTWDDTPSWEWGISYYYFMVNDTQSVSWRDAGFQVQESTFLDKHKPATPDGTSINFLYELPARAKNPYDGELAVRKTFVSGNCKYAVTGYNTVQLINVMAEGVFSVPETVEYGGITYTVISIGFMNENTGLFDDGSCFKESYVTKVYIPKTVTFIWDLAFRSDTLESITVDEENEYFRSVDGVLFTKSMFTLIQYPSNKKDVSYSVPNGCVQLAYGAFRNLKNLYSLDFGNTLRRTGITGWGVRYDNSYNSVADDLRTLVYSLKGVLSVPEENPYWKYVGGALYSVNSYGDWVLIYVVNTSLKTFIVKKEVIRIETGAFTLCDKLITISVEEGNSYFTARDGILYEVVAGGEYKICAVPLAYEGDFTIPDEVTYIGGTVGTSRIINVFSNREINRAAFGTNIKRLGYYAFAYCASLECIEFGGTAQQWAEIDKLEDWCRGAGDFVIECTDATLDKNGNVISYKN